MSDAPTAEWLRQLCETEPDIELMTPAADRLVRDAGPHVGELPSELEQLLRVTNGLTCRTFRLYPLFDESNPKKTWDSLQRVNDPANSDALGGDIELHKRFLVFADIGGGHAMLDRRGRRIWYAEAQDEDISETDLTFREFIETMVRNAE